MKLRRAMAVAAATAVIAPAALLAAPAAYATTGGTSTTTSETPAETSDETSTTGENTGSTPDAATDEKSPETTTPEAGTDANADKPADAEAGKNGEKPGTAPEPDKKDEKPGEGTGEGEEDEEFPEPPVCKEGDLELNVEGLPGKIAAGSGWHTFTLNVYNGSEKSIRDVHFFAGAALDDMGEKLFKTKQVELQVKNDDGWETLDMDGDAVGYVGQSDEIEADYEVDIPMRLNVKANAPAGAAFTLGAGVYVGEQDCVGGDEIAYKFQIVKAGTDTDGTKPQEGGKVPVPDTKPANDTSTQLTGSLAETGSNDMLPVIGIAGGFAVVAGAGVVFALRRRSGGAAA
ncbi:hypothetical protein [Streptomyces sp.]|uniref:hypothetical protein n=1 Tax=Streptomyces sp. TaxID=1931 RepID=UPI002F945480